MFKNFIRSMLLRLCAAPRFEERFRGIDAEGYAMFDLVEVR